MKLTIQTEHETLSGTPEELVRLLNKDSKAHTDTSKSYMQEAADRASMLTGKDVRFDSAENFINDLATVGLIKVMKVEEN